MTTSNLILLAATIGALFGGSVVLCVLHMRAVLTIDNAPVPPPKKPDMDPVDLAAPDPVRRWNDDYIARGRRELTTDPVLADVVPGPWAPRVVEQRGGERS